MPGHLPNLLSLTYPLIDSLAVDTDPDGSGDEALALHELWTVFTRCKNELRDGKRLENIAWRLYSPLQAPGHLQPRPRTPSLSSAASTSASSASPVHRGLHPNARQLSPSPGHKRTFGSVLNLVLAADQDEEWQRLKDWVGDAEMETRGRGKQRAVPKVAVEDLDLASEMGVGVRRETPSESSTSRAPVTASSSAREPTSTSPLGSAATSLSTSPYSQRRQRQHPSTTSSTASSLQTPHRLNASASTSTSTTPHTGFGPSFQLRLVEPTPAPSRVGSLGADLNAPSSGPGSPAQNMALEPAIEEEEARVREHSAIDLTELNNLALSKSPTKPASATPQVSPIQTKPKAQVSPGKKKEKRMFFIQRSPCSVGTVATSGGESETGGSSFGAVSPTTSKGAGTSPLSAHGDARLSGGQKRQRERSRSPMAHRQASVSPSKLATSNGIVASKLKKSQTNLTANHGHQRRRSSGSSRGSAVKSSGPVAAEAPAPIKRVVSAATMQGRFRGQKMAAAAAIQEKNQVAAAAERHKLAKIESLKNMQEETGGWEDEDGESIDTEEDEEEDDEEEDDEGWSDEGSEEERVSKEEEKKRAEEADKQRQREMFAKRQIFGPAAAGGLRQHASAVNLQSLGSDERPLTPGLLSGMFKSVESQGGPPRRGGSMVDLQSPAPLQRRATSTAPPVAGPSLIRSKSAVAIPIQTGLSVSRDDTALEGDEDEEARSVRQASPEIAVKPKPPLDTEMEDSDESQYSAPATSYLATSEARRKLSALAAKRDASKKKAQSISPEGVTAPVEAPYRAAGPLLVAPVPVVAPQTPTTTRRNMIMNEMSESLRMNLIWERRTSQASLGPPKRSASFATAARPLLSSVNSHQTLAPRASPNAGLQTSASAHNLQQIRAASNSISPNPALVGGGTPLARQMSHPVQGSEISPPARKRTAPNLLSGGGILRPLTRVGQSSGGQSGGPSRTSPQLPNQGRPLASLARGNKSRSSADLAAMNESASPYAPAPMVRSNTDGGAPQLPPPPHRQKSEADLLKMQLRKREEETNMSYRSHGW